MGKNGLIIFQKNAVLGKVKTRIAKKIGDQKALEIYEELSKYTHQVCSSVEASKYIYFSDFIPSASNPSVKDHFHAIQSGIDLGSKMKNAFQDLFAHNFEKVVLIGTDCGEIESKHLEEAFQLLESFEVVLGPARDGGYYLVGLKIQIQSIFENIPWSTAQVLLLTLEKLDKAQINYSLLDLLSDVDEWEDWIRLNRKRNLNL